MRKANGDHLAADAQTQLKSAHTLIKMLQNKIEYYKDQLECQKTYHEDQIKRMEANSMASLKLVNDAMNESHTGIFALAPVGLSSGFVDAEASSSCEAVKFGEQLGGKNDDAASCLHDRLQEVDSVSETAMSCLSRAPNVKRTLEASKPQVKAKEMLEQFLENSFESMKDAIHAFEVHITPAEDVHFLVQRIRKEFGCIAGDSKCDVLAWLRGINHARNSAVHRKDRSAVAPPIGSPPGLAVLTLWPHSENDVPESVEEIINHDWEMASRLVVCIKHLEKTLNAMDLQQMIKEKASLDLPVEPWQVVGRKHGSVGCKSEEDAAALVTFFPDQAFLWKPTWPKMANGQPMKVHDVVFPKKGGWGWQACAERWGWCIHFRTEKDHTADNVMADVKRGAGITLGVRPFVGKCRQGKTFAILGCWNRDVADTILKEFPHHASRWTQNRSMNTASMSSMHTKRVADQEAISIVDDAVTSAVKCEPGGIEVHNSMDAEASGHEVSAGLKQDRVMSEGGSDVAALPAGGMSAS